MHGPRISFLIDQQSAPHGGALPRSPALRPEDVELRNVLAAEVTVLWGDNVLHVAHCVGPRGFVLGDEPSQRRPVDFLVPREKLGARYLPLVVAEGRRLSLALAPHAEGYVVLPDGTRLTLAEARDSLRGSGTEGSLAMLTLEFGTEAVLRFGDISVRVSAVRAGKPIKRAGAAFDPAVLAYMLLSALSVGGLLSTMAFLVPPLGLSSAETDDERLYLLQAYLSAAAERERERLEQPSNGAAVAEPAASGERAEGAEGTLGRAEAKPEPRRMAFDGGGSPARERSRAELLEDARNTGIIEVLGAASSDVMFSSPMFADRNGGSDDRSAFGPIWGKDVGDVFGTGFAMTGSGRGGGGAGKGIAVGDVGTIGSGQGGQNGEALAAAGRGRLPGSHRARAPRLRAGETTVGGRLPAETIRRTVQQHHSRFRACYEEGLMRNPRLGGRIGIRFVIGSDGRVVDARSSGSDLPDPKVVECVRRAFSSIGFTKPVGGVVTVQYPLMLQPD